MSLSPARREILENMLLFNKPAMIEQIAKEAGKEIRSVRMHLIRLALMGYANSPEKGQYTITEKGKEVLGIPEINKENAKAILAPVTNEKAFHFYAGIGKPLSLYAYSLQDFCDKILKLTIDSIEFHVNHEDFEAWFAGLGDVELAIKTALLKEKQITGEELRGKLLEIAGNRCRVLAALDRTRNLPE
jgi:DNA-binding transcriptional ArsR family regulator